MRDVQTVVRVSERSAALQPRHPPLVGSAPAYRVMMTPPTHVCGLAGIASRRATPPGKAQAHAQVRKVGLVDCQLRLYIRRLPRAAWSCVHWRPSLSCSRRRCRPCRSRQHALVISSHPRGAGFWWRLHFLAGALLVSGRSESQRVGLPPVYSSCLFCALLRAQSLGRRRLPLAPPVSHHCAGCCRAPAA